MPSPLSSQDADRYLAAALTACRAAGEIHRHHFRSATLAVETKADASPVTVADRGSEEAIRETLHRATPDLGLLGEEFGLAVAPMQVVQLLGGAGGRARMLTSVAGHLKPGGVLTVSTCRRLLYV